MSTASARLLLAMLMAGPATAAVQVSQFPSETQRVTVDVVVTDGQGRPVAGLSRDDFVVKTSAVSRARSTSSATSRRTSGRTDGSASSR
ncbi:MAG TPA: hypothetical protein VFM29_03705 [Vicinamibacteria bacterium]|nr:hypothetical protein [Vicinamibacteria bacterium]